MKRLIGLLLIIAMLFTLFVGCGDKETETGVDTKEASNSDTDSEDTDTETGVVDEAPTILKLFIGTHPSITDVATNAAIVKLEEKFNVKFELEIAPYEATAMRERMMLMLASGEYPDIILGQYIYPSDEITMGENEGILIDLSNLIEERSTYLKPYLDANPVAKGTITSTDGKIYSLPQITENPGNVYLDKMWINRIFLDNLGLEMPTTTDEFYDVLMAFKNDDPNGNGEADEIPLVGARGGWGSNVATFIMNSFVNFQMELDVDTDSTRDIGFYLDNGQVKSVVTEENYRAGLQYLNKLYEDGLLYEGSFTQDASNQLKQIVEDPSAPLAGVVPGIHPGLWSNWGERFEMYASLAPLDSGLGDPMVRSVFTRGVTPGHSAITSACEYPELAFDILDYCYSEDMFHQSWHGNLDEDWVEINEGIGLNGEPALWGFTDGWIGSKSEQNNAAMGILPSLQTAEWVQGEVANPDVDMYTGAGFGKSMAFAFNQLQPYTNRESELPSIRFTEAESVDMQSTMIDYAKYVRTSAIEFILGVKDSNDDGDWNSFLKGLENLGHDDILAQYQMAYDRQYN